MSVINDEYSFRNICLMIDHVNGFAEYEVLGNKRNGIKWSENEQNDRFDVP